ncbi:MAG: hypothetical protein O2964_05125, partial [Verrucomicrobia bacterium]|nr:hypothetical protein [Verrucomicrobiota bacterium]
MRKKHKNRFKTTQSAWVLGGLAGMGLQAQAVEPDDVLHFKVGNVHIRPQFGTGLNYNDNIFFRSTNPADTVLFGPKEGDLIANVNPGVSFTLGRNEINTVSLTYRHDHRFYTDHSEVSSGDHSLNLLGAVTSGKVRISTDHSLSYLTGIQGGTLSIVEQNDRISLVDHLRVNLDVTPKSDIYVDASHSLTDQGDSIQFADINSWRAAGGYGFKYSENLRFFSQLNYGVMETSVRTGTSQKWDFVGGSIGAEGSFTEKLTGTLQFGYERRSSDMTGVSAGAPTVTVELEQILGDRTLVALAYTRANQVNVDASDTASVSDIIRLTLRRALGNRQKWFASVYG